MQCLTIPLGKYIDMSKVVLNIMPNIKVKSILKKYKQIPGEEIGSSRDVKWLMMQYHKQSLCYDNYATLGLFRSVLSDGIKICCYSPPKSVPFSTISSTNYAEYELEELVEGTMINLFWNAYKDDWEIATKGNVGGDYKFFKDVEKTFRVMFLEAMLAQDLEFEHFNSKICYSFVLQHPENRIVVPFKHRRVILVAMYIIDGLDVIVLNKRDCTIPNILFPEKIYQYTGYSGTSWEDLNNYFNNMDLDYSISGVNIYNKRTGLRGKIRNPTYEYVRRLKGNSTKIQYQYYSLRKLGKVGEFLKYYGEYNTTFFNMRSDVHLFTHQLWLNYMSCYVKKQKPLLEFKKKFRNHMFQLHQIYLNDLLELGHYISKEIVIKYINSLEPAKLMYSINYDLRQQAIEAGR